MWLHVAVFVAVSPDAYRLPLVLQSTTFDLKRIHFNCWILFLLVKSFVADNISNWGIFGSPDVLDENSCNTVWVDSLNRTSGSVKHLEGQKLQYSIFLTPSKHVNENNHLRHCLSSLSSPVLNWCACAGSTTPRWDPPSWKSLGALKMSSIQPSKRYPSSTVMRTSHRTQKSWIWRQRTWRAFL